MNESQAFNEPVFTGWLQIQMSGNIALAKSHERQARHIMGQLLINHGINERMAAGEPTGYFKVIKDLEDGTRISAWHNNGMNLLRVDAPRGQVGEQQEQIEAAHEWPSVTHERRAGAGVSHEDQPIPPIPRTQRETVDGEEEEKREEGQPYMWVGIRSTNPGVPYYALNAVMAEPPTAKPGPTGVVARGIVDSIAWWDLAYFTLLFDDMAKSATHQQSGSGDKVDFDAAIAYHFAQWAGPAAFYPQPFPLGEHSIMVYDNTYGGLFLCSKNGLRCYVTNSYFDGRGYSPSDDRDRWMPFDPLLPVQNQTGGRIFGDRHMSYYNIPERAWDVVYVLDPSEEEQTFPCDERVHISSSRRALEAMGMAAGETMVLSGDYLLALQSMDTTPGLASVRAGQAIPLYPDWNRSSISDYDGYMRLTSTTANMQVEIEVRLGKGEDAQTFTFTSSIETSDDRLSNTMLYGYGPFDACSAEGGLNPKGPNWMAGYIAINPGAGTAGWAAEGTREPALSGGTYAIAGDTRKRLFVYVMNGYGVDHVDPADYAAHAGYAVYRTLEACSAGVYGTMLMNEWSEAAITAAFAGANPAMVNRFDSVSGQVDALPVISSLSDYDWTVAGWDEWWYWYYPYKLLTKDQCQNSMAVLLSASITGWSMETGQHRLTGEPEPPDCC